MADCGEGRGAISNLVNHITGTASTASVHPNAQNKDAHNHYVGLGQDFHRRPPSQPLMERPPSAHIMHPEIIGIEQFQNNHADGMVKEFEEMNMVEEFAQFQRMPMHPVFRHQHPIPPPPEYFERAWAQNMENNWAEQFQQESGPGQQWAEEFSTEINQESVGGGFDQGTLDRLRNSDNPKFRNSKFVNFLTKLNNGELKLDEENKTVIEVKEGPADQFENIYNAGQWVEDFNEEKFDQNEILDNWVREFEDMDWARYLNEGANPVEEKTFSEVWEEQSSQKRHRYRFAEVNPYLGSPNAFETGLELMNVGHLTEAVLAFEAEVQRNMENSEAWSLLGKCQQENENDNQAISALEEAVNLDPYDLDALLMLGVSHTNDLERHRALEYLRRWIEYHPTYQGLISQNRLPPEGSFENVVTLFLAARDLSTYTPDCDVETVLGVLYNISNEYDKAVDCFQNATRMNDSDPSLWNKLGATMANGGRSVDAVEAYRRALELKPNYVRALANLGISFANQGMHSEAAQTYLATLDQNPEAVHVWNYLKITLSSLGRSDLSDLANLRDVNAFREFFDF